MGHYARNCFRSGSKINNVLDDEINNIDLGYINCMFNDKKPLYIQLSIEGVNCLMEIDTGACVSVCHIMSEYEKYFNHCKLLEDDGNPLKVF